MELHQDLFDALTDSESLWLRGSLGTLITLSPPMLVRAMDNDYVLFFSPRIDGCRVFAAVGCRSAQQVHSEDSRDDHPQHQDRDSDLTYDRRAWEGHEINVEMFTSNISSAECLQRIMQEDHNSVRVETIHFLRRHARSTLHT
jgi:hypothetical protein